MSDIFEYAKKGNLDAVRRLITQGISVDERGLGNNTPIIHASDSGHSAVVEYLISVKANVDAQGEYGWTALICASANGYLPIIEALLTAGADPSLKNNAGKTAEDVAIECRKSECAQAIREHIARGDDLGPKAAHFTGAE